LILLEKYNPVSQKDFRWVYVVSLLFVALNAVLIAHNQWWLGLVPLALIVAMLWFLSLDKLLLLTVFLTPLSVTLDQLDIGTSLSLPSEPLMFGITTIFVVRQLFEGDYDRKALACR